MVIRPIRPEDEPLVVKFHEPLSEESIYLRYFHLMSFKSRVAHDRLSRICFIDYDREIALVADYKDPETGEHQFLGVARISQLHGVNEAEFAMIISDRCQNQGLGTELLQRLVAIGRDRNFTQLTANILPENTGMQRVCQNVGFQLQHLSPDTVLAVLTL